MVYYRKHTKIQNELKSVEIYTQTFVSGISAIGHPETY